MPCGSLANPPNPPALDLGQERYWVWFDALLEEYFWLEESVEAPALLAQLRLEGVALHRVVASTPFAALEAVFPDRKSLPAGQPLVH